MYPPKLIKKPFIWEVGHKFKVDHQHPPGQRDR